MNETIAKNLAIFLEASGRRIGWVRDRIGLDEETFQQLLNGEEEALIHLEKFAKLFRRDISYFYDENMIPPLSIDEIIEKYKDREITIPNKPSFIFSTLENIEDHLLQADGIMKDLDKEHPKELFEEVVELLKTLEIKSEQLLQEAREKEMQIFE